MFANDLIISFTFACFDFIKIESRDGIKDIMQLDGVVERDYVFADLLVLVQPLDNVFVTIL